MNTHVHLSKWVSVDNQRQTRTQIWTAAAPGDDACTPIFSHQHQIIQRIGILSANAPWGPSRKFPGGHQASWMLGQAVGGLHNITSDTLREFSALNRRMHNPQMKPTAKSPGVNAGIVDVMNSSIESGFDVSITVAGDVEIWTHHREHDWWQPIDFGAISFEGQTMLDTSRRNLIGEGDHIDPEALTAVNAALLEHESWWQRTPIGRFKNGIWESKILKNVNAVFICNTHTGFSPVDFNTPETAIETFINSQKRNAAAVLLTGQ